MVRNYGCAIWIQIALPTISRGMTFTKILLETKRKDFT